MIRARTFFVPLLLALLVGSAFLLWRQFGDQTPRARRNAAKAVASAQRELAKLGPATDTPSSLAVAPQTFALLQTEKHQLRDLIRLVLESEPPTSSSEQLRKAAVASLAESGVQLADAADVRTGNGPEQMFGRINLQLERVLGHKELVAAKISTSIPCGADGALYLFEQRENGWSPVLAHEAPAYSKVSDAYGSLDYAISPQAQNGWYALIASVTPGCGSLWQEMRYSLVRKGADPYHPKTLLSEQTGLYQGWDEYWKLKADADTAQVAWPANFKLDGAILIRAHVAHYQVSDGTATRIPPVALYPEDFVDEWAQQPWAVAKEWIAPEALPDAESIHGWLGQAEFPTTLEFLQPCPIPEHWQIGFTVEAAGEKHPPSTHVYVDVSKDGDVFRLDRIAGDRVPGCSGNEILPQRPRSLP